MKAKFLGRSSVTFYYCNRYYEKYEDNNNSCVLVITRLRDKDEGMVRLLHYMKL